MAFAGTFVFHIHFLFHVCLVGHSHWQNVAHIKKEKNLEKAAIRAPLYVKMRDALRGMSTLYSTYTHFDTSTLDSF